MKQAGRGLAVLGFVVLGPVGLGSVGCGGATPPPTALAGGPVHSATATPAPSVSATPPPAAKPRATPHTAAELKKALLTLADAPSGLSIVPDDDSDGGYSVTSSRSGCAPLVKLMNAAHTPGSVAEAGTGFDGGSSGPFFGEELDAFPADGARTAVGELSSAVRACGEVSMDVDGSGKAPFSVETTSAPDLGQAATAVRFTETDSDDFQFDVVFVAADDVLLSATGIGSDPADLEDFTSDAYDKLVHGHVSGGDGVGDTGNDGSSGDQPA